MDIMWCLCVEVKIQGFVLRICYVSFLNVKVFVKNSYKLPYEEQDYKTRLKKYHVQCC